MFLGSLRLFKASLLMSIEVKAQHVLFWVFLGMLFLYPISSVSLLPSDLAEAFPPGQLRNFFANDWVEPLIKQVRQDKLSGATKEVAKWLRDMMKRQL